MPPLAPRGLREPPIGAVLDPSHPLTHDLIAYVTFNGLLNAYEHVRNKALVSAGTPAREGSTHGPSRAHTTGTTRLTLGTNAGVLPNPAEVTIAAGYRSRGGAFGGAPVVFCNDADNSGERCLLHGPYTNGVAYWNWGDYNGGPGEVSASGLTYTRDTLLVVTEGPRAMEIWQDGRVRATGVGGNTRGTSSPTVPFNIGGGAATGFDSQNAAYWFFAVWSRQLSRRDIVELSERPFDLLAAPPRLWLGGLDAGSGDVTGTGAATLTPATSAATGAEVFTGAAAGTVADATSAATGTSLLALTGTAAGVLAPATSAATGLEVFAGTAAGTVADATGAATGTALLAITGTAAGTLLPATSAASGSEVFTGTHARALTPATAAATGLEVFSGTAAAAVAPATSTATGSSLLAITGTAAGTVAPATGAATGTAALAVAFGAAGAATNGSSQTSAVVDVPAGVVAGSVVVVFLHKENAAAVTWPSGFTEFASVTATGGVFTDYVAWKRATGAESGTYTATWTGATWRRAVAVRYDYAVAAGSPIDQTNTEAPTGTAGTLALDGVDPTYTDTLRVLFGASFDGGASPWATAAGTTERVDAGEIQVSDAFLADATPSGAATLDPSGTQTLAGIEFTLIGATSVAAGSTTGSAAGTAAPVTSAAAGIEVFAGTHAPSLTPATSAASGSALLAISGAAAGTLTPASSSAAGLEVFAGTGAGTLAPATGAATGTAALAITGTAAATIAPATSAASGLEVFSGAAAGTTAPASSSATGTSLLAITGTHAAALAPATSTATGSALLAITGTGAGTTALVTSAATGATGEVFAGTAAGTLAPATGTASGLEVFAGTAAGTTAPATSAAAGSALLAITGTGAATLVPLTSAATGSAGVPAITGIAAGSTAAVTSSPGASGAEVFAGSAAGTLPPTLSAAVGSTSFTFAGTGAGTTAAALSAAVGSLVFLGAAAGTLAAVTSQAEEVNDHRGTFSLTDVALASFLLGQLERGAMDTTAEERGSMTLVEA